MKKNSSFLFALGLLCALPAAGQDIMVGPEVTSVLEQQRTELLTDKRAIVYGGLSLTMCIGKNNTNEFRFCANVGISRAVGDDSWSFAPFLFSYQLQLEGFRGGVGSSLLDEERARFQWELRNVGHLNMGWLSNNDVYGRPLVRTAGASESPIKDPYDYSIGIGTIFVNGINHNRNQQLGVISVGVLPFQVSYGNDGPFFSAIGFGDGYDRYWTGIGHIGLYFLNDDGFFTSVSAQYLRYTGWQPNLYELGNILEIDYMSYKDRKEQFLNQGVWNWEIGIKNNSAFNFKYYEARKADVQNLLHIFNNFTFHPNTLGRRISIGGSYKALGSITL